MPGFLVTVAVVTV